MCTRGGLPWPDCSSQSTVQLLCETCCSHCIQEETNSRRFLVASADHHQPWAAAFYLMLSTVAGHCHQSQPSSNSRVLQANLWLASNACRGQGERGGDACLP